MNTTRYIVRLLDTNSIMITTVFLCKAIDECHALEQAENQYPGCEFLSCERIEYPE